jgi:hypothetical protein
LTSLAERPVLEDRAFSFEWSSVPGTIAAKLQPASGIAIQSQSIACETMQFTLSASGVEDGGGLFAR